MNYIQESKYRDSDSDSYSDSEEEEEENEYDGELHCKNIDPALAKLMGIIIEEKANTNNLCEWVPPTFSGLSNSVEIIPRKKEKDLFNQIKDDVMSYRTLTPRQLEYIKNMNNDQKYEMIQIYNKTMEQVLYRKK